MIFKLYIPDATSLAIAAEFFYLEAINAASALLDELIFSIFGQFFSIQFLH